MQELNKKGTDKRNQEGTVMENNKKNQKGMNCMLKTKGDDSQEIRRAQIKQKGWGLKIIT